MCASEELAQLQRQWIGLQSIFGSPEALQQLPDETEAFERVDGFWRAYLRKIRNEQSNVITVVEEEGLFEIVEEKNKTLAAVQRKLEVIWLVEPTKVQIYRVNWTSGLLWRVELCGFRS